jgi:hypothetical protein
MDTGMRLAFLSVFAVSPVGFAGLRGSKAEIAPAHRVFILHSYEFDHVCGNPQRQGVIGALEKAGRRSPENPAIETSRRTGWIYWYWI